MTTPDISIIIVNWNSWNYAFKCLESVRTALAGISHEIFLIDNHSTDDQTSRFSAAFDDLRVTLLRNPDNKGFAAACNQGMALSSGRHILLLNPDTVVAADAIAKPLEYMNQHPAVGVLGCRLVNEDGSLQRWTGGKFPSVGAAFNHYFFLANLFPNAEMFKGLFMSKEPAVPQEVDWVCGAYLLARREAVDATGLMNTSFFMYAEDMDWCYRMKRNGWLTVYYPSAQVLHYSGKSMAQLKRQQYWRGLYSISQFYRTHGGGGLRSFLFDLAVVGGYLIRTAGYLVLGLVRKVKFAKAYASWRFFGAAFLIWSGLGRFDRPRTEAA